MFVPVTMKKAEKYAVNLRKLSEAVLVFFLKTFGCTRKVYNLYVDYLYEHLEKAGYTDENIADIICKFPEVTEFKKEYEYLKEVDSLALSNAKIHFENAVKKYDEEYDHKTHTKRALRRAKSGTEALTFRGLKGMPKFKAKAKGDFSYTTNCQYPTPKNKLKNPTIQLDGNKLHLPKIKEDIELIVHRPLPDGAVIKNATVTMETDGSIYVPLQYEYEVMMDITLRDAVLSNDTSILDRLTFIGLDYSQPDFYVDSEGRKANTPHAYRKSEEKLAKLQHELSRMVKGSSNYKKQQKRISKLHIKIKNQRLDFVRKEANKLVKEYDVVVVEDIDLRGMGAALSLGKNLHDNGFGMFRDILAKKLEEKGSILVKVNRFFASTKTCSHCGYVNNDIQLSDREWVCPVCGTHHYRDENAGINIKEEGKRILFDYFRNWLAEKEKSDARANALSEARKAGKKNKKTS